MKKLIAVVFICLVSFGALAQEKIAKIKFDKTTIDYGTIAKGADGVRTFDFS